MFINKSLDVDTSAPTANALFEFVDLSADLGVQTGAELDIADSFEFVSPTEFNADALIIPDIDVLLGNNGGASISTSVSAGVSDSGAAFASLDVDAVGSIDATIGIGIDFGMIDLMIF